MLALVWSAALAGTILKLGFPSLPRWTSAAIYLAMGWVAVIATVPMARAVPTAGSPGYSRAGFSTLRGRSSTPTRRPNPFPRVFGFHEIFHLFVLGGSAAHFVFMLRYVAPA